MLVDSFPGAPAHMALALTFNGMSERLPDGTLEPRVRAFFDATGYPRKLITVDTPWCAAFVSAMLERTGMKSTRSAAAASYLTYGTKAEHPDVGDVVVLPRDGGKYHVAFWAGTAGPQTLVYAGNSGNRCRISLVDTSAILAVRRPASA